MKTEIERDMESLMLDDYDNPGPVWEKLVKAVSLIGLTTETTEYLFEHDSYALNSIDEALESLGVPITTLRNRSIDLHIDEEYLPLLGSTFLPVTHNGVDHESVRQYIVNHLDNSNGSWELVFFPHDEPEPTGVNEDYADMLDDTHTEEEYLAEMGTDELMTHLEQEDRRRPEQLSRDQRGSTDASGQLHLRRRADRRGYRSNADGLVGWGSPTERRMAIRRRTHRARSED
jgi:hypothetical protein